MPQTQPRHARSTAAPIALAAIMGALSTGAGAETDPYYFGISQSLGHDSNLYRVDNQKTPDKFAVTSLIAGFDQPIGRQRVFANASVRATRYEDIKILNNTGYGLSAGLDWSTIERLSGSFGIALNRSLANYAASGSEIATTNKNLETSGQANMRVQLGLVSLLSLSTTLSHGEVRYSAPGYQLSEVRQNAASLGLVYRPSGLLTLGSAVRATRGEYPNVVLASGTKEGFRRNDLDLTATWVPSGLSTLNARISYGKSTYDSQVNRDFKGSTGSLGWAWQPTGKLTFNTSISRDSGTETSLAALANSQGNAVGDSSVVTNAFALSAGYEATAKIRLNLGARYARRNLVNNQYVGPLLVQSSEGSDSVTSVTLGANYLPSRAWQLGCNAGQDSGRPSNNSTGVSTRYTATTASCYVQLTIR